MILIEANDADFLELIEGRAPRGLRLPSEGVDCIEVLAMLRELANSVRVVFNPATWMMVEADEVVGPCSIVKPPGDAGVDIGYSVSRGRRRSGLASAAVGELVKWGRTDSRVLCISAETSVSNIASQRVLECNGCDRIGERVDEEDGQLIRWQVATAN